MTRPTDAPEWASSANYPADASPEASTATKVATTADDKSIGNRPAQYPTAQRMNWWQNLVYLWLLYFKSITEPKWLWISCSAGTIAPTNAPHGTIIIGASAGFFGEAAQINYIQLPVVLPEGARMLKLGIRYRHAAGEAASGTIGGVTLYKHDAPANGVNAANTPQVIAADPPAGNPASFTLEIEANNAAGQLWETKTIDLDQADDVVVIDQVSYTLLGTASGLAQIESIGIQYQLDS